MELTLEEVREFQRIYLAHVGVELSERDARVKAAELIALVAELSRLDDAGKGWKDGDELIS